MRKKSEKHVDEAQTDTSELECLEQEVRELQRIVEEKQLKLDFLEKVIELAEQEYGVDIKKSMLANPENDQRYSDKDKPNT